MITKMPFNNGNSDWININSDSIEELESFCREHSIDKEIVAYSLDRNERPHIEYDQATKIFVLIFNVANLEKIDNHYETLPMIFIIKEHAFITVTNNKNQYVVEKLNGYLRNNQDVTIFKFLFTSLFIITDSFFPFMEEMNTERKIISDKLKVKTTKQNLLSLSDLETGIVYFVSASKQNVVLLEQVKAHMVYRGLNESEKEQFEDALVEAKQLVEMTQISSQILQQLSGTYNNILNNNLNDTMKTLTVLSILLTVPTIITGFFGMNMPLPFENDALGWIFTIIISIVLWLGFAVILRKLIR